MQRCDAVMASGHSVDTFAIPALQPLVLNLFVRPGSEGPELETQREVVLSMLLRVVDHSRVLSLLTHVLDCFSHSAQHWHRVSCDPVARGGSACSPLPLQVSSQILASLLNAVARLSLVLDSADSMATLYHLFSAMDPSAISMKVSTSIAGGYSVSLPLSTGSICGLTEAAGIEECPTILPVADSGELCPHSHAYSLPRLHSVL